MYIYYIKSGYKLNNEILVKLGVQQRAYTGKQISSYLIYGVNKTMLSLVKQL